MNNEQLQQRRLAATPRGCAVMHNFYADKAENATLWDIEGRTFIDFAAGIAVLNTGHRHPKVIQAIQKQLEQFTHTAYQIVPYASYVALAERLNDLIPIAAPCKTVFFSTGAEAVENAVKIARAYTGRPGIITFSGGFHGRTLLTLSMTGKVNPYKMGFGPFASSIFHARYPNKLHGISVQDALDSLHQLFYADIEAKQVAAIVLEPVQGEGGFNIAPVEFMRGLRELCDQNGIVLIADEIQTGFARTGKLFAMEHYPDSEADIITMAKSLAGGMPLSAVSGRAEIMDAPAPGGLGGTYAGNPLAIAAAHAVLDTITEEQLCQRAQRLGQQLTEVLHHARQRCPALAEIRTLGSMVAIEFIDPSNGQADPLSAQKVQRLAKEQGLLLLTCGSHGNVIRFLYPLTIPESQFHQALMILSQAITE